MRTFTSGLGFKIGTLMMITLLASCNVMPEARQTREIDQSQIFESIISSQSQISTFAVFGGGAGITNQGTQTVITGDMGTTGSSTMITGFHSADFIYVETPLNVGTVNGSIYTAAPQGTEADFAYATETAANLLATFNDLAALPGGVDPGAGQLGGLTLIPGVYKSAAGPFLITGDDLTLDGQGNPDAVWVFQMASALTIGNPTASQSVILTNGAQAKNVYWQVGSSATINGAGGGTMVGTIISSAAITFSTAGNATLTVLNGRALALFASVTMVNTVINASGEISVADPVVDPVSQINITGTNAVNVVPVVTGGGFINVENNGGLVTVTENGTGTISVVNNGGILTATNTGNGLMTINSDATGTVTVTNTGNGKVTVNATGSAAIAITHTGDDDYTYPVALSSRALSATASNITVTGSNATDVTPVVTGGGYINVHNNGAHVAATQTGTGSIKIVNNGGVLTATNTGTAAMNIRSTATGAVTVTNTGNGNVTVIASGSGGAYAHTGSQSVTVYLP